MKYEEITISTLSKLEDIVSDVLICNGSEGVEIVNGDELRAFVESSYNRDLYTQELFGTSSEVLVRGFFAGSAPLEQIERELDALDIRAKIEIRAFDDSEYRDTWKQFYKPLDFGEIVVVPSWIEFSASKPILRIDPATAFGTGSHETTAMCLEILSRLKVQNKTVADIGCGSGILGLSALVLGAKCATLTDIDADALQNARQNAELNGLQSRCEHVHGDLFAGEARQYDIIFANIVADVLIRMCKDIPSRLASGGCAVVSGILSTRLAEVERAIMGAGLRIAERAEKNDWCALRVLV